MSEPSYEDGFPLRLPHVACLVAPCLRSIAWLCQWLPGNQLEWLIFQMWARFLVSHFIWTCNPTWTSNFLSHRFEDSFPFWLPQYCSLLLWEPIRVAQLSGVGKVSCIPFFYIYEPAIPPKLRWVSLFVRLAWVLWRLKIKVKRKCFKIIAPDLTRNICTHE